MGFCSSLKKQGVHLPSEFDRKRRYEMSFCQRVFPVKSLSGRLFGAMVFVETTSKTINFFSSFFGLMTKS